MGVLFWCLVSKNSRTVRSFLGLPEFLAGWKRFHPGSRSRIGVLCGTLLLPGCPSLWDAGLWDWARFVHSFRNCIISLSGLWLLGFFFRALFIMAMVLLMFVCTAVASPVTRSAPARFLVTCFSSKILGIYDIGLVHGGQGFSIVIDVVIYSSGLHSTFADNRTSSMSDCGHLALSLCTFGSR